MKKIATLLLLLASVALSAQNNMQWRGENRTGVYNETGLLKAWPTAGPELLWNYDGLGEGHSSVAIANGKIFLTGMPTDSIGVLYMLDMTGKLLKEKVYGTEWYANYVGPRGTATVSDGKVYLVSGMGTLYCFDENSLDILWQKNIKKDFNASNITWGIAESPLIVGEKIIFTPGGKEHNVVALNKKDGSLIWSSPGEGSLSAYCSPIYLADQEVPQVVTMTADYIIGVDIATGKKLWSYENKNRHGVHANTPVYGDNMLLCTSGYGKGSVMLRLTNGGRSVEKVWESAELDSRMGAMVKLGNYAYGSGDANKYWFCVNWQTGELTYKDNSLPIGVVIADDGMLYCYSDRGDMALVKAVPEKFDLVSRFKVTLGTAQHWAHPVIYNGVLYLRHGNSLMAYKIK